MRILIGLVLVSMGWGQQLSYNQNLKFQPGLLSDQDNYSTFYAACNAAVAKGMVLAVTKHWTVQTGTCAASVQGFGGVVKPASGQTVTMSGAITAPPTQILCDRSAGGICLFSAGATGSASVKWFGALGNNSNDDTAAMQATINACMSSATVPTCDVLIPEGVYKTTSELVMTAWGQQISGSGKYNSSTISYQGLVTGYALSVRCFHCKVSRIYIQSGASAGWSAGLNHEGSQVELDDIFIDCNTHPGDALTAGKESIGQSDQLTVIASNIGNCPSGHGFRSFQGNALSVNFFNCTVGGNWIGFEPNTSTNVGIFGGEIDTNDVNFDSDPGAVMTINGVRSEGSKHTFNSAAGSFAQPTTYQNYDLSDLNVTRPATTLTASNGAGTGTISTIGFTLCDSFTVAGESGSPIHRITSMSNMTSIGFLPTMASAAVAAAMTLDASSNDSCEQGGGPYVHIGYASNTTANGTFTVANGPQIFIGSTWRENTPNPFGLTATSSLAAPGPATLFGNFYNGAPGTQMINTPGKGPSVTFTANSTTQDVSGATYFFTANTSGTCINQMNGGYAGEVITIAVRDANTTWCKTGNIQFSGSAPLAGSNTLSYQFVNFAGIWNMIGSSGQ